jgi:hypothetical protein
MSFVLPRTLGSHRRPAQPDLYLKLRTCAWTVTGFAQRTALSTILTKVEPAQSLRGWAFGVLGREPPH